MMCRCLKVSRSGYYAWLGREPSRTVRRRKELSALIEWVLNSSHGTYGYRRVHAAGARRGVETSPGGGAHPSCAPRAWRPHSHAERTRRHRPGRRARGSRPDLVRRDSRRQQAGRAGGWAISPISAPGRGSCTWRPSPAAARRKQSSTRLGRQHAAPSPLYARRSIWQPAGTRTRQEKRSSCPRPGLPVHLRAARRPPGELRHSPFGGQDRGVLGGCLGGSRRMRPSRNERVYQMVYPTRSKAIRDIASWIELEHTIRNDSTPPWGTGRPTRSRRSTEQ